MAGSPFASRVAHVFETPGENGSGDNDWMLVLEAPGARKDGD
jgi:hypothetical protein